MQSWIYQFARTIQPLKKSKATREARAHSEDLIKKFEEQTKPKVEKLIQEGATYISLITMHIFYRFSLIDSRMKKRTFAFKIALDLSTKAKAAGDDSSWNKWREFGLHLTDYIADDSFGNDFEFLRDKLLTLHAPKHRGSARWYFENRVSASDINRYFEEKDLNVQTLIEQKKVYDKLGSHLDNIASDPELLCTIFRFLLQSQNWIEADKLSPKMLDIAKTQHLPTIPWITAKIKIQLNKLNEAVQVYNLLLKQDDFNNGEGFNTISHSRIDIFEEFFKLKYQLLDWAGADDILTQIIKEAKTKEPIRFSEKLYQQFIDVKRHLKKDKEAEGLEIINFIEHFDPNNNQTPVVCEALEKLFQTTTLQFIPALSSTQLFNLAAICFNLKDYAKADYLFNQITYRPAVIWSLDNKRMFLQVKGELKQWQAAYELWESYNDYPYNPTLVLEGERIKEELRKQKASE